MILLFGKQAAKASSTTKTNSVKTQPVENSGILAMGLSEAKSLLTIGEYDTYISSNPSVIDYAMYANYDYSETDSDGGFMSNFSAAVAFLGGDGGFFGGSSFDCGGGSFSCSSGGSFASVC